MKKLTFFCLSILLCLFIGNALPVCAQEYTVKDVIDLYDDQDEQKIEELAEKITTEFDTNVIVLVVSENGFSDNYARDFIEQYGVNTYPEGYIAYIVNMADRSYWIDAYGDWERSIFTQNVTDHLSEIASDDLSEGAYGQSAVDVLKEVYNQLVIKATPGGRWKKPFLYPLTTTIILAGSVIGALIAAGVWTAIKSSYHHDKQLATSAESYAGNFNLNQNQSVLVNHYQTRVPRPKETHSSGGFSGGGGSSGHTGSGGHF